VYAIPGALAGSESGIFDARIWMTLVTLALVLVGLGLLRAPPTKTFRLFQVMVVLPTGSLFMATGGDDLPILALCFVAVALASRRRVWATGLVLGIVAAMKLTAWPIALAIAVTVHDQHGRRAWGRVTLAAATVVACVVAPFFVHSPRAFVTNVFAFPLGLSGVHSPAASPLPGHILHTVWAPAGHVFLLLVCLVGLYFLVRDLRRTWPWDLSRALRVVAIAMAVVFAAAPATRIGYLVYPVDLWLWAWVLRSSQSSVESVVLVEAQRPRR
jgi:hypothetical protein